LDRHHEVYDHVLLQYMVVRHDLGVLVVEDALLAAQAD
jgi:hypothetical protein